MPPFAIEPLSPATARADRARLERLYYAAFSPPPYAESLAEAQAFGALVERDSRRPGFDAFVARDARGLPVGLVYGYDTPHEIPEGPWWARLMAAVGPARAQAWILGQFAFCWFAVDPAVQGQGVGGALYRTVMERVTAERAWLVTHGSGSTAREMYDRRGWRELARAELGWVPGERVIMVLSLDRRR
jgi:ribosomal protein S18 acetylase RimI-like enzyme